MLQVLVLELAVTNVQEVELKIPPAPPSLHDTVPVGVVGAPPVSVTVAVNIIEFPILTDDGFGVMFVVVEFAAQAFVTGLPDNVPELLKTAPH